MKVAKYSLLGLLIIAGVLLATLLPLNSVLMKLVEWSQHRTSLAVLIFFGLVVLAMILLFPVSIQAMASGFLFGLKIGFLVMWIAGLAGFIAAFLVGRGFARPWIHDWAQRRPEFLAIDRAIGSKGLLVVVLARLSQLLPYNMLNYAFGLTSVSLRDYVLGSAVGMLPGIFMFVLVGSTATDIASVLGGKMPQGDFNVYLAGFGLLAAGVAVAVIAHTAKSTLKGQLEE